MKRIDLRVVPSASRPGLLSLRLVGMEDLTSTPLYLAITEKFAPGDPVSVVPTATADGLVEAMALLSRWLIGAAPANLGAETRDLIRSWEASS